MRENERGKKRDQESVGNKGDGVKSCLCEEHP